MGCQCARAQASLAAAAPRPPAKRPAGARAPERPRLLGNEVPGERKAAEPLQAAGEAPTPGAGAVWTASAQSLQLPTVLPPALPDRTISLASLGTPGPGGARAARLAVVPQRPPVDTLPPASAEVQLQEASAVVPGESAATPSPSQAEEASSPEASGAASLEASRTASQESGELVAAVGAVRSPSSHAAASAAVVAALSSSEAASSVPGVPPPLPPPLETAPEAAAAGAAAGSASRTLRSSCSSVGTAASPPLPPPAETAPLPTAEAEASPTQGDNVARPTDSLQGGSGDAERSLWREEPPTPSFSQASQPLLRWSLSEAPAWLGEAGHDSPAAWTPRQGSLLRAADLVGSQDGSARALVRSCPGQLPRSAAAPEPEPPVPTGSLLARCCVSLASREQEAEATLVVGCVRDSGERWAP